MPFQPESELVEKHYGPGNHPSGSSQDAHGQRNELFHGTTEWSVERILEEGFHIGLRQRWGSWWGEGAYLTPDKWFARTWAETSAGPVMATEIPEDANIALIDLGGKMPHNVLSNFFKGVRAAKGIKPDVLAAAAEVTERIEALKQERVTYTISDSERGDIIREVFLDHGFDGLEVITSDGAGGHQVVIFNQDILGSFRRVDSDEFTKPLADVYKRKGRVLYTVLIRPKVEKHYGPGNHPSGSSQKAHGSRAEARSDVLSGARSVEGGGLRLDNGVLVRSMDPDADEMKRTLESQLFGMAPEGVRNKFLDELSEEHRQLLARLEEVAPGLLDALGTTRTGLSPLEIIFHSKGPIAGGQEGLLGFYTLNDTDGGEQGQLRVLAGDISSTLLFRGLGMEPEDLVRTEDDILFTMVHELGHRLDHVIHGEMVTSPMSRASETEVRDFTMWTSWTMAGHADNVLLDDDTAYVAETFKYPIHTFINRGPGPERDVLFGAELFSDAVAYYYTDRGRLERAGKITGIDMVEWVENNLKKAGVDPTGVQLALDIDKRDTERVFTSLAIHGMRPEELQRHIKTARKRLGMVSKHPGPGGRSTHSTGSSQDVHGRGRVNPLRGERTRGGKKVPVTLTETEEGAPTTVGTEGLPPDLVERMKAELLEKYNVSVTYEDIVENYRDVLEHAIRAYKEDPSLRDEHRFYERWFSVFDELGEDIEGLDLEHFVAFGAIISPGLEAETNLRYAIETARFWEENPEVDVFTAAVVNEMIQERRNYYLSETYPDDYFDSAKAGKPKKVNQRLADAWDTVIEPGTKLRDIENGYAAMQVVKGFYEARFRKEGDKFFAPKGWDHFRKGWEVLSSQTSIDDALNGIKVRSFYNNALDPTDTFGHRDVTIDFQMMEAGMRVIQGQKGFPSSMQATPSRFGVQLGPRPLFADAVRELLPEYGSKVGAESPAQLQEVIWHTWKLGKERGWWEDLTEIKRK